MMPICDPRDGFFYPILTLMMDSYNLFQDPSPEVGAARLCALLVDCVDYIKRKRLVHMFWLKNKKLFFRYALLTKGLVQD